LGVQAEFISLQPHAEDDDDENDEREPLQPTTFSPRLRPPHAASVDQASSTAISRYEDIPRVGAERS
jgi:hypothetical protein